MQAGRATDALFTDFYELTMAQAYWRSGVTGHASFSLFFRRSPPGRGLPRVRRPRDNSRLPRGVQIQRRRP